MSWQSSNIHSSPLLRANAWTIFNNVLSYSGYASSGVNLSSKDGKTVLHVGDDVLEFPSHFSWSCQVEYELVIRIEFEPGFRPSVSSEEGGVGITFLRTGEDDYDLTEPLPPFTEEAEAVFSHYANMHCDEEADFPLDCIEV